MEDLARFVAPALAYIHVMPGNPQPAEGLGALSPALAYQTRLVGNFEVITSFVVTQLLGRVVEGSGTTE